MEFLQRLIVPWIGVLDGERVGSEYVEDGVAVTCPDCNGRMYPRGPFDDGRARHFWHTEAVGKSGGSDGTCVGEGGESDTHKKLKSFAVSRLRYLYDEQYTKAAPEVPLGEDQELASGADRRVADALVKFDEPSSKLGNGLIIEVQYRNEDKDIEAVEQDYLSLGYSIVWTNESDYSEDGCTLNHQDVLDRMISVWPNAVPELDEWKSANIEGLDLEEFRLLVSRWNHTEKIELDRGPFTDKATRNETLFFIQRANRAFHLEDEFEPPEVPVTLPKEYIDEKSIELWRDQDWLSLFGTGRGDQEYIEEAFSELGYKICEITGIQASFPPTFFMEETRQSATYRKRIYAAWKRAYQAHQRELKKTRREVVTRPDDPDPPSSPFDDVQCRECGTFWYIKKEHDVCPNCGADVDPEWNRLTGRISQEAFEQYFSA